MNPIYMIPFILAPVVGELIGYIATVIGVMPITYIDVPWVTPPFINAFLATGGKFSAVIVQFVAFVAIVALYTPFVLISNKVAAKQAEQEQK